MPNVDNGPHVHIAINNETQFSSLARESKKSSSGKKATAFFGGIHVVPTQQHETANTSEIEKMY